MRSNYKRNRKDSREPRRINQYNKNGIRMVTDRPPKNKRQQGDDE